MEGPCSSETHFKNLRLPEEDAKEAYVETKNN